MPRFIEVPAELFYVDKESSKLEQIGIETDESDYIYEDSVVVINVDFIRMFFPSGGENIGTLGDETAVKFFNESSASYLKVPYREFTHLVRKTLKQDNCFIVYNRVEDAETF
ncbi:MAG: hypothetical protein ACXADW_24665 [Candidatus Hodarchaeales archaeon]|jgi:hypothetical protein